MTATHSAASHHPSAARADALVMFGLTGDLGEKKLLPALVELAAAGELDHPVIAVGRSEIDADELRERLHTALREHRTLDDAPIDELDLHFVRGGVDDDDTWAAIHERLGGSTLPVVYAALPPDLFGTIARRVATSGMPDATRLIVEKPFGNDRASARDLWDRITAEIGPDRLFVVDHFLAKTAIENLLTVRTCNAVIANNLRPGTVQRIDVIMHEDGGVDGRGSFYESVGAVRDVVQNHMLQLLALATMPAPPDDSEQAYLDARDELLDAIEPVDPASAILGQYDGYRDLDDVDDDSDVETYAALEVTIDRDPWRGVPVHLVTGKRLHEQRTAVVFTVRSDDAAGCGRLVFDISPRACISIELEVLDGDHDATSIVLAASPGDRHGVLSDYATMLLGGLEGERRHFATIDGILAGWRVVDPVLRDRPAVRSYAPGTSGP